MDDDRKIINSDLGEEELALANFLANRISEYRYFNYSEASGITPKEQLLAFLYPYDLEELTEYLVALNSDFFTDGTLRLDFNGSDLVLDILPILRSYRIDPKLITDEYDGKEIV